MPQSTSKRLPFASTRYLDPVTVPAAPRNVSFAISQPLYRNARVVAPRAFGTSSKTKRGEQKLAPFDAE